MVDGLSQPWDCRGYLNIKLLAKMLQGDFSVIKRFKKNISSESGTNEWVCLFKNDYGFYQSS